MKKFTILLLFFLLQGNLVKASVDIQTGRNIIVNGQSVCLDNINTVVWDDRDQSSIFLLNTGDTRYVSSTYNEFVQIQQAVFASRNYRNNTYDDYYSNNYYNGSGNYRGNPGYTGNSTGSSAYFVH